MKNYDKQFFGEKRMVFMADPEQSEGVVADVEEQKAHLEEYTNNALLEKTEELQSDMLSMTEEKFHALSQTEQLLAITNPPGLVNDFTEGTSMEITFHGNKTLEQRITAGTFPAQVEEITVIEKPGDEPMKGKRRGLKGEFYAPGGERLRIYEGTVVTINKTRTGEEMQIIQAINAKKAKEYAGDDEEKEAIAEMSYESGVPPEFVEVLTNNKKDMVEIQQVITEIGRKKGQFEAQFSKEKAYNEKEVEFEIVIDGKKETVKTTVYMPTPKFVGFVFDEDEKIENIGDILGFSDEEKSAAKDFRKKNRVAIESTGRNKSEVLKEIMEGSNLYASKFGQLKNFSIEEYLYKIGQRESRNNYRARNDREGAKRGVDSDKWAFGKYQFIVGTLRGYDINLGRPPNENAIQSFLSNHQLQENIMRKFTLDNANAALKNGRVMQMVNSGVVSWGRVLAAMHFAGASGGIRAIIEGRDMQLSDWLGGSNYTRGFA